MITAYRWGGCAWQIAVPEVTQLKTTSHLSVLDLIPQPLQSSLLGPDGHQTMAVGGMRYVTTGRDVSSWKGVQKRGSNKWI